MACILLAGALPGAHAAGAAVSDLVSGAATAQVAVEHSGAASASGKRSKSAATKLPRVTVTGAADAGAIETPRFPGTVPTIDAQQIATQINAVDVEDAVKYLPSLFVRKRNFGDTQPVLATRTWGVNSSVRSLVYVDGIPISALIANNNTLGAPRWGVISPQEIDHVDMLYGPYSAAYPGNSIGGVLRVIIAMKKA